MYCFLPFKSYPVACILESLDLSILTDFHIGGILSFLILSSSAGFFVEYTNSDFVLCRVMYIYVI